MSIFNKKTKEEKIEEESKKIIAKATSSNVPDDVKKIVARFLRRREEMKSELWEEVMKRYPELSTEEKFKKASEIVAEHENDINRRCRKEFSSSELMLYDRYMDGFRKQVLSFVVENSKQNYIMYELNYKLSKSLNLLSREKENLLHSLELSQQDLSPTNPIQAAIMADRKNPTKEEMEADLNKCYIEEEAIKILMATVRERVKTEDVTKKHNIF